MPILKPAPTGPVVTLPRVAERLDALPQNVDRRRGAALVTEHFFPVSHRTLEVAPLAWRHVNGKAIVATRDLFDWAQAKLDAAPVVRGGRRPHAKGDSSLTPRPSSRSPILP